MNEELSTRLELIPPEGVRRLWPDIRDRMLELSKEVGNGWLPEEVFADCMAGSAYLWATEQAVGFVVLVITAAPWGRELYVWIADNETTTRAAEYWEQLKEIAAIENCVRVTFESPRRWVRAIPDLKVRYSYHMDI